MTQLKTPKPQIRIALISALPEEIDRMFNFLNEGYKQGLLDFPEDVEVKFHKYVTGVGFVNASSVGPLLAYGQYDFILNVGSCGSLSPTLRKGSVVISTKITQPFLDLSAFTKDDKEFRAKNDLVTKSEDYFGGHEYVSYGVTASGDKFVSDPVERLALFEKTGAIALDMESAVLCRLAGMLDVPFVSVRVVSDDCVLSTVNDYKEGIAGVTENRYHVIVRDIILTGIKSFFSCPK